MSFLLPCGKCVKAIDQSQGGSMAELSWNADEVVSSEKEAMLIWSRHLVLARSPRGAPSISSSSTRPIDPLQLRSSAFQTTSTSVAALAKSWLASRICLDLLGLSQLGVRCSYYQSKNPGPSTCLRRLAHTTCESLRIAKALDIRFTGSPVIKVRAAVLPDASPRLAAAAHVASANAIAGLPNGRRKQLQQRLREQNNACRTSIMLMYPTTGSQAVSVCSLAVHGLIRDVELMRFRMLESPQDESIVRWGNEGDSFVVLEACIARDNRRPISPSAHRRLTERNRTKSLPNTFSPNISSIATSPVLYDS